MRNQDEEIARKLAEASASGELERAEGYGKPAVEDDGWSETPPALRQPFKILKDAGVVPREIEMFRERAELSRQLAECADPDQQRIIAQRLSDLEQAIALRLEALRASGSL
jgi:hypothetical protein